VLNGDRAPTWVVGLLLLTSWHLDGDHRLRRLLLERYRLVGVTSCGPRIWLRRDLYRRPPRLDCP
jgi:hypothetical protein